MPTDQTFDSDGVEIAYDDVGEGPAIALVHGFASDRTRNWRDAEWYDALTDAGRRVVALDCRGHGDSETPHEPEAYARLAMPRDVVRLLDHLSIEAADLMGYSMGGRISQLLAVEHPERFNAVVLGGVGRPNLSGGDRDRSPVAEALEADDPDAIDDPRARGFREFAEEQGNDLAALAAYQRAPRGAVGDDLADVSAAVLVVNGSEDDVGDPRTIADAIPGAEAAVVPDRDHLSTVGDRRYKDEVLAFLEREGLSV